MERTTTLATGTPLSLDLADPESVGGSRVDSSIVAYKAVYGGLLASWEVTAKPAPVPLFVPQSGRGTVLFHTTFCRIPTVTHRRTYTYIYLPQVQHLEHLVTRQICPLVAQLVEPVTWQTFASLVMDGELFLLCREGFRLHIKIVRTKWSDVFVIFSRSSGSPYWRKGEGRRKHVPYCIHQHPRRAVFQVFP